MKILGLGCNTQAIHPCGHESANVPEGGTLASGKTAKHPGTFWGWLDLGSGDSSKVLERIEVL